MHIQTRKWRKQHALEIAIEEKRKALQNILASEGYWKDEIIVDNFAGGGGASTGIELAIGRSVNVAINHDQKAIAMHEANHPQTYHYCEDVWAIDPRTVMPGRPIGLIWLSPDCTHHSKARGGKPREKNIRGLAWVAVRWAATRRPRVIMLENVEEFQDWGPLDKDGKPIKAQKGRIFRVFVNALRKQGYEVEWKVLKACDYGAPTTRKRLFLIARCDGLPIVWPMPTHGEPKSPAVISGQTTKYRTAAEIIDWDIGCPSIFERKRPLADNTMRRIARGMFKYVINNPDPFIAPFVIKVNHSKDEAFRGQSIDKPLQTITGKNGWGIVTPFISRQFGQSIGHPMDIPSATVTAGGGGKSQLITAFLAQYHTETAHSEVRGQSLDTPIMTLDTSNRYGLVTGNLIKFRGDNIGSGYDEPVPTITAGGMHIGEVRAFLVSYYGASVGQDLRKPLGTVTTHDRFGLVLIKGSLYQIVDIGMRMLTPRELYNAQGFPITYIINPWFNGKPFPQAEQVAKCGNSVSPVLPNALVRANLPEHCVPELSDRYSIAEWEMMLA